MPEENQRQYEITFILAPNLEKEGIDSLEKELEKKIQEFGGSLKSKKEPKKRELTYPIKKFQSGYYLVVNFLLDPEKLKEMTTALRHEEKILRCLITTVLEKKPSFDKSKIETAIQKTKPSKKKVKQKIKEITEEVTEEKIEKIKKETKEKKKKEEKKEKKQKEKPRLLIEADKRR